MISERSVDISRPFHLHINDPGGTSTYSARSPDHYPLFHQLISCRHSFLCPCQDPGSGHYTSGLSAIDCHNCFRYFFFLPYPRTWHINPLLPSHEPLTILLSTTQGSLRPIHSLFMFVPVSYSTPSALLPLPLSLSDRPVVLSCCLSCLVDRHPCPTQLQNLVALN